MSDAVQVEDVDRLRIVAANRLREEGFSVGEIAAILDGSAPERLREHYVEASATTRAAVQAFLAANKAEIMASIRKLEDRYLLATGWTQIDDGSGDWRRSDGRGFDRHSAIEEQKRLDGER